MEIYKFKETFFPMVDLNNDISFDLVLYRNAVFYLAIGVNTYINSFREAQVDLDGNTWQIKENGTSVSFTVKNGTKVLESGTYVKTSTTSLIGIFTFSVATRHWNCGISGSNLPNLRDYRFWTDEELFRAQIARNPNFGVYFINVAERGYLQYYGKNNDTGKGGMYGRDTIDPTYTAKSFDDKFTPDTDPFTGGGTSKPGGGGGGFRDHSDPIPIPPLPPIDAGTTGFVTLFDPTAEQLRSLSSYMWSDLFDIAGWKKIMANPMDCILGLSIVPVPHSSIAQREVKVGGIGTGVYLDMAGPQFQEIDCGSIEIKEYWGGYLDYSPYTKFELTLPYIGTHAINADDVMEKTVTVKYHVDILSGACVAYVLCGESVLYSFAGQCACQIPITGNDWSNAFSGALAIAGSIGAMVATSGLSAPLSAGALVAGGASIAGTVMASKPQVEKSGAMGGTAGMMAVQKPYFTVTRPRQALPKYQNKFLGYPAFITSKLGDLTGFTVVEQIHIENTWATGDELTELEALCKQGIII